MAFGTNAPKKGDIVRTPRPGGSVQATVVQYGPLWARIWYFGTELGRLSINSLPKTKRVL